MGKTKKRILIIDDDADFCNSIRIILENHNYKVYEASSGKEGLQKLKSVKPDLIILDIMMETINEGYALNSIIKYQKEYNEYRQIPILMLSSIQEHPLKRFALASGEVEMINPDYYLTKPVDITHFLDLVKNILNLDYS